MSDYKPITGELRKYMGIDDRGVCYMSEERFDARCDEIDAIHAQLERENAELKAELDRVTREQEDRRSCIYYDPKRNYCSWHDIDTDDFMELPKDANDEYIHEHDNADWRDHAGTWHENATVVAVCSDGCYVMDGTVFHVHKSDIRHHHAPTVEDVLQELVIDWDCAPDGEDKADVLKEYAAKLQLKEDE